MILNDQRNPSTRKKNSFSNRTTHYLRTRKIPFHGEPAHYVAAGEGAAQIFDRSNPTEPSYLGAWPGPSTPYSGYAETLVPVGSILYVADGEGLHVLDVSNPASVGVVGSDPAFPRVLDLAVSGGFAYGALFEGQLQIADVSIPGNPILGGNFDPSPLRTSMTVDVSNGKVFLACAGVGLSIFDASEVDSPMPCGGFARTGELLFSTGNTNLIYLSGQSGVQVLELGCASSPDVNADGFVDARDLLRILGKISHQEETEDVNCDGLVDSFDLLSFQADWKLP